ncbi:hypothetical protein ACLKA6_008004 [Drosophila palustris]
MKLVTINNVEVQCLVDTGADVSIMRKCIFNKIPDLNLDGFASKLRGLGNKITCPVGCFQADVGVDEEVTSHKFVIVADEDIEYDALLGFDFVSKFNFSSSIEGYKFSFPKGEKAWNTQQIYSGTSAEPEQQNNNSRIAAAEQQQQNSSSRTVTADQQQRANSR